MADVKITMKDGTVREFLHKGRPGGSWTVSLTLENGFAVVTDEYGKRTVIPSADIADITETPNRHW